MKAAGLMLSGLMPALLTTSVALAQEMELDVGDRLSLTIAGLSELDRELTIGETGTIAVPLLGHIDAAGRTVSEIESEIKQAIPDTVFRQRNGNNETLVIVRPEEVSLEVVSYRPVVIDGAVANPGEVTYAYAMTVRQAIAMAGGLDQSGVASDVLDLNDYIGLRLDHETRVSQYANVLAELGYSQALLDGASALDIEELADLPLDEGVAESLTSVISSRLESALFDRETELTQLNAVVSSGRDQLYSALQLLESSNARLLAEEAELERVQSFLDRNLYTEERLVTARRAYHQALVDTLEAEDRVTAIETSYRQTQRQISGIESGMDTELQASIAELTMQAQQLDAEISELGAQLELVDLGEILDTGRADALATVIVYRFDNGEWAEIAVDMMDELEPGDMVSVSIESSTPS